MRLNSEMRRWLSSDPGFGEWPDFLDEVVDGIAEIDDGVVVSAPLKDRSGNATIPSFVDATGYEAFVNHVHVDDYVQDRGLWLAVSILYAARIKAKDPRLVVIISIDEQSCTVRFHRMRVGEEWLSGDLEGYADEGIMVL
jgi:hypothetical protein